jgi:hypothetical protein
MPETTNIAEKTVSLSSPESKFVKPKKIRPDESITATHIMENISNASLYDSTGSKGEGGPSISSAMRR